ncbi:MAG: transposase [Variibacter sp.]
MDRRYEQLSLEDRREIARLQADGASLRQIAAALHRAPSSIAREVKRNRGRGGDKPSFAQEQTRARRWAGSRLDRDPALRRAVLEHLTQGWSPEQVAGRLARERATKRIRYESIYRFIYAQIARTKDYGWRQYLPRAKSKRGFRGRKGGSSASFIQGPDSLIRTADRSDRSTDAGPLGSRPDAVLQVRPGRAHLA